MARYISDLSSDSEDEPVNDGTEQTLASDLPNPLIQEPSPSVAVVDEDSESGSDTPEPQGVAPKMAARAYQLEMLEESLKRNIIVAMDTGSGKTLVAVRRIMAELERSDKLVWFLTKTVVLAGQQFEVIRTQIPAVQAKCICGADNADSWSKEVWDAALLNVRIVVSTYQILFDAVTAHAFVPFASLGLVVFDEAHNCVKQNAGAKFMRASYWPAKDRGLPVPHILGLTASPLMGSDLSSIDQLERTLDAVCMTPKRHRGELLAKVNRPELRAIPYEGPPIGVTLTRSIRSLSKVYSELDIERDPYVVLLRGSNTARSREKLRETLEKKKTYIQTHMKSFRDRSRITCEQLGPWAADYYIQKVISNFAKASESSADDLSRELSDPEKRYLARTFARVEMPSLSPQPTNLSNKVEALIDALLSYEGVPVGIVFVKERMTVAVLSHILSLHPGIKSRYRIASMIGISQNASAKQDFLDLNRKGKGSLESLDKFRSGKVNLLVATNVLEEGIDVPACNLVICFDPPCDLKSFIQRRGRARKQSSQLCLLIDSSLDQSLDSWTKLEEEMKKKYADDMRENQLLEQMEESSEIDEYPCLEVASTGARLTIDETKGHLEHFCATLSSRKYVDRSPYYVVRNEDGTLPGKPSFLKATVHLPASLPYELRQAESSRAWLSEKNACKDAAFQAYAALFRAGLLNEHLLPLKETNPAKDLETRPGMTMVRKQLNPWQWVARAWRESRSLSRHRLIFSSQDGSARAEFELVLPVPVPALDPLTLYWDSDPGSSWLVNMHPDIEMSQSGVDESTDHTIDLIKLAYGHRWPVREKQPVIRFVSVDNDLSSGARCQAFSQDAIRSTQLEGHLIRDPPNANHPYFYLGWLPSKPALETVRRPYLGFEDDPEDVPYILVKDWPKKAGFFHPVRPSPQFESASTKPYPRVLLASRAVIEAIPPIYSHFGMAIPAITHTVGVRLLANDLMVSRLSQVGLTDLALVATAISASSARLPSNYERIEFLGDTILKFCATVYCSARKPDWPEGYLSAMKDRIVSNLTLCRAAVEFGLDQYIVTKAFTLDKWRPMYVDDLLEPPPPKARREMSTKTLADVVEALIGASFIEGGIPKALECIALFLPRDRPDEKWLSIESGRSILYNRAPSDVALPVTMQPLEGLIGYTFNKKSLLVEAMTHSSYTSHDTYACLERLEFLGDAILDYIVVTRLFNEAPHLKEDDMHLIRTCLVNADFLGFQVMEWSFPEESIEIMVPSHNNSRSPELKATMVDRPLWSFMRHASGHLGLLQRATAARHNMLAPDLRAAMNAGDRYPWALLARLQAQKVFSDVFESVLGAVWVDSGSLDACAAVLERAGVLPYMRRMLAGRVHARHPKEDLGRDARDEKVRYVVEERVIVGEDDDLGLGLSEREFMCKVYVGDRCYADVGGGVSREEVRTLAADKALRALQTERGG